MRAEDGLRDVDRILVVLSDIEMGAGGPRDDFRHDDWLAELLLERLAARPRGAEIDFVFNGDTLDFLKTPGLASHPHHVSEHVALGKLSQIASEHPRFFSVLGELVAEDGCRVHLIIGNHDLEIAFDLVQQEIRGLAGLAEDDERIAFPGLEMRVGDVHIEHGSQSDPMFRVDPDALFVELHSRRLLAQPWGAVALLATAIPMADELGPLDRLRPRTRVFEVMPEAKELLLNRMWSYWTRDFVRDLFDGSDPLTLVTWPMFREVLYRFSSGDPQLAGSAKPYEAMVRSPGGPQVVVLGHRHTADWRSVDGGRIVTNAAMRDEFMLDIAGVASPPVPKTFIEVAMRGGHAVRTRLVEVSGPRTTALGPSVDALRERVVELLNADVERPATTAGRLDHEEEDARRSGPQRLLDLLKR